MERLFCLLIGYLLGMIQTAYIYGRTQGIDIRKHGSGNAGTTNALRTLGKKAGIIVLLGDILKCVIAVNLCLLLFGQQENEYLIRLYAGAGAILGHNFPFYMGFKGGKGIAAMAGLLISFNPWFILVGAIVFFGTLFITHYVSLGSILLAIGFLAQMVVFGEMGKFDAMPRESVYEMYVVTFLLVAMAIWKHRGNLGRLRDGTERKTYLGRKSNDEGAKTH